MVKHTQTIRRQFADELFECVWSFYGIGAYRVKYALFIRRGNKVLIRKIKIISGCNTDLVKSEANTFPKTNKGVILILYTQDAFGIFRILFYISQTKK